MDDIHYQSIFVAKKGKDGIYKIPIPRPEHHLFPQDTVVLHNLTIENQEDCWGIILDVQDDGIIVEAFGYMGCDEYYSLELIG